MSLADLLQRQHRLGPALRERLRVIAAKKDKATWQELQQTGVLLSEKAESFYQVFGRLSNYRQIRLLELAKHFFVRAHKAVEKDAQLATDNQVANAHDAINCDEIMAIARLARAERNALNFATAVGCLDSPQGNNSILAACIERAEGDESSPAFGHQAGIASAFRLRVAAGELFGFPGSANPRIVAVTSNAAKKYLGGEESLDGQQAYRTYLTYLALFQFASKEWQAGRAFAKIALRSAKKHGDASHAVRAGLILLFGRFGNRIAYALGMLRDEFTR